MSDKTLSPLNPTTVVDERTEMPRPLRPLPGLPERGTVKAVRAAAKNKLGMSDKAAGAMATIWARPEEILPQIDNPRRMRVPGGDLLFIEGTAWSSRLVPDPKNPRNAADFTYVASGANIDEPTAGVTVTSSGAAEIYLSGGTMATVLSAVESAMERTRSNNREIHPPIKDQGVMDAPFGVMGVIQFDDGTPPVAVPLVKEGSSRTSNVHEILGTTAEDMLLRYPASSTPITEFITEMNQIVAQPAADISDSDRARVRCATMDFILIVGFEADTPGSLDLASAIKVKVAQEHLNTKQDWSAAAQDSVMADDCLEAAFNAGIIGSADEYGWLLGNLTRADAAAASLTKHPDDRFTKLVWLFGSPDKTVHNVIRRPIAFVLRKETGRRTSQVRKETKLPLAVELTARELRGNTLYGTSVEKITKVLAAGASVAASNADWKPTSTPVAKLVERATSDALAEKVGPSGIELAVRALYYAALHDVLRLPRNDQGIGADRRSVADVLIAMLGTADGVQRLGDIVVDGRRGTGPQLRTGGETVPSGDGTPVRLTDKMIRTELHPKESPVKPAATGPALDPFMTAQREFAKAMVHLKNATESLEAITDTDGEPLIGEVGLNPVQAKSWRHDLREIQNRLEEWYEAGLEHQRRGEPTPVVEITEDSPESDGMDASAQDADEEQVA